jgi:hypothetical protein
MFLSDNRTAHLLLLLPISPVPTFSRECSVFIRLHLYFVDFRALKPTTHKNIEVVAVKWFFHGITLTHLSIFPKKKKIGIF